MSMNDLDHLQWLYNNQNQTIHQYFQNQTLEEIEVKLSTLVFTSENDKNAIREQYTTNIITHAGKKYCFFNKQNGTCTRSCGQRSFTFKTFLLKKKCFSKIKYVVTDISKPMLLLHATSSKLFGKNQKFYLITFSGAHTKIVEDDIQEDIQCCKQNLIQKKTVSQQLQTANQQYFKDRLYMFYQPLW
ncbi:Hypothetical_protein [Hexamita inflata]|uniref:Hypothetical_protein n=1 Tax=Hexamita inflata TaxID=28002 RepID=A0AA86V0I8_9EUKA|nr:Hypothetical protein HINF_LOCUS59132 [Hexamita inflata]